MAKQPNITDTKAKLLPRISLLFFGRPLVTLLLWVLLISFGIASYTTFMKRAEFPAVNIPVAVMTGNYLANDPTKVDSQVAKPIVDAALKDPNAKLVQSRSFDNFFSVAVQYQEGTDSHAATNNIKKQLAATHVLPPGVQVKYNVPYFGVTGGDIQPVDLAVSFYANGADVSTEQLAKQAQLAADYLNKQHLPLVKNVFVKNPFEQVANPATGQATTVQKSFDRFGERKDGQNQFHNSVLIAVAGVKNVDALKIDKQVQSVLPGLLKQPEFKGYGATISASYAPGIHQEISELQRVLLEGLIAVLVIGSIIIALRASLITVISMVTVIAITIGVLYVLGYTLNVITLFALILGLSLIVDDTIIMVEAIDAARRNATSPRQAISQATRKISLAMLAATTTAALSFAPFLFVSGVLGDIIRPLPVTIITALLVSFAVALVFIPLFARVLLLGKKQLGEKGVREVAANVEATIARGITKPMRWAQHSRPRLFSVGISAVLIGFAFIFAGGMIASKVVFNIFPPTKDTNQLSYQINFKPGTDIKQAEAISAQADNLVGRQLGTNFVYTSYYDMGSTASATAFTEIIDYKDRAVTSPQLVKQLQHAFDTDFPSAQVVVSQVDVGPPSAAFEIDIRAGTNRTAAYKLANDIAAYMRTAELKRPSGKVAHYTNPTVSNPSQILRNKEGEIVTVSAGFDGNDTTTLVTLAQKDFEKHFPASKLQSYGLPADVAKVNLGQESENQNSFKTLVIALPFLLLAIYLLLSLQFRSLLQPMLIFMAVPFSIFGVMLGLFLTDNPISFFSMLGFFALIGLSIKNTILVVDYANQARRAGLGPVDATIASLGERFRPLIATSLTAVVALIPLAVTSPFWQGLAVVLIFGLLSSTTLVILVFPYYYLGGEYLRLKISRRGFFTWLLGNVAVVAIVSLLTHNGRLAFLFFVVANCAAIYQNRRKKLARSA
ncbi:MAG TPA: efflux RND transporter permease subunit [Candidatus Saccharimonadales bacterium]|nr:efflux RND transporter permease subunit [Candidatus Saccharimonadales bacterium]